MQLPDGIYRTMYIYIVLSTSSVDYPRNAPHALSKVYRENVYNNFNVERVV